jgi:hypothetical protein
VRTAGTVALLHDLTLPEADPLLDPRSVAEADLHRRLVTVTRDGPTAPRSAASCRRRRDAGDPDSNLCASQHY